MERSSISSTWTFLRLSVWIAFWTIVAGWALEVTAPARVFRTVWFTGVGIVALTALVGPLRRAFIERGQRALRVLDLVTVNAVIFVVFAELAVLSVAALTTSPLLAFHDADAAEQIRHYRYPPNGIHNGFPCNSQGFVDEEFEIARRDGVPRIAVLGDSFAVSAVPYEENFITLLDEGLDTNTAEAEVLNFGVSSSGLPEYLHLWRTEAARYQPDLVLLCFFIGNDVLTQRTRQKSLLHADSVRFITVTKRLWRAREWGLQHDSATPDPLGPTLPAAVFEDLVRGRLEICRKATPDELEARFAPTRAALDEIHAAIGDRLRVLIIPSEFQVSDPLLASLAGDDQQLFDRQLPNQLLTTYLDSRSIPYLDLLADLRAAEKSARTYKPRDTHWNAAGNALAANRLTAWLGEDLIKAP